MTLFGLPRSFGLRDMPLRCRFIVPQTESEFNQGTTATARSLRCGCVRPSACRRIRIAPAPVTEPDRSARTLPIALGHPVPLRNCRHAPVPALYRHQCQRIRLDGINCAIREVALTICISKSVNKFRFLAMIFLAKSACGGRQRLVGSDDDTLCPRSAANLVNPSEPRSARRSGSVNSAMIKRGDTGSEQVRNNGADTWKRAACVGRSVGSSWRCVSEHGGIGVRSTPSTLRRHRCDGSTGRPGQPTI